MKAFHLLTLFSILGLSLAQAQEKPEEIKRENVALALRCEFALSVVNRGGFDVPGEDLRKSDVINRLVSDLDKGSASLMVPVFFSSDDLRRGTLKYARVSNEQSLMTPIAQIGKSKPEGQTKLSDHLDVDGIEVSVMVKSPGLYSYTTAFTKSGQEVMSTSGRGPRIHMELNARSQIAYGTEPLFFQLDVDCAEIPGFGTYKKHFSEMEVVHRQAL